MGPRLESRGDPDSPAPFFLTETGFNGAAARKPRRRLMQNHQNESGYQLQWGRGSKAAETETATSGEIVSGKASMGPRLESRGDVARTGS